MPAEHWFLYLDLQKPRIAAAETWATSICLDYYGFAPTDVQAQAWRTVQKGIDDNKRNLAAIEFVTDELGLTRPANYMPPV